MGITRTALLKPEVENQLRLDLKELWTAGKTAKEIADILEFGVKDTKYAQLKVFHVWLYRSKFAKKYPRSFPKRGNAGIRKGQPRYKTKPEETMSFTEFKEQLNRELPKVEYKSDIYTAYVCRKRAYLILHFWCPLRKSEIYERLGKDFRLKGKFLKIDLYRKKKFYKQNADTEPFYLNVDLPLVDEVIFWVKRFGKNKRPFDFCGVTAWRYVKDVFPTKFPHFWRFDWITKAIDNAKDPGKILIDLLQDTGLNIQTVKSYIMKNPRFRGSINARELELIKEGKA